MPRGGRRPGAGRPKGSVSKRSQETAARLSISGNDPLDFLLAVMRNEEIEMRIRHDAAKAAAPFMHTRLAAISHTIQHKPAAHLSDDELTSIAAGGSEGAAEAPDDPSLIN